MYHCNRVITTTIETAPSFTQPCSGAHFICASMSNAFPPLLLQWAHLASPVDSPDSTWRNLPSFVRDKFITYLFSDHIVNGPPPQRSRHGVEEDEMDDDEQEDQEDVGLGKGTVYRGCEMGNDDCDNDGGDERQKRQESEDSDRSEDGVDRREESD